MKKLLLLILVMTMFGVSDVFSQTPVELVGVWKMTYKKWELADTVIERSEYEYPYYKIFYDDHFSLTGVDENNEFVGHFGSVTLEDNTYTEQITFSSYDFLIGRTVSFDSELKGNTWTIRGDIGNDSLEFKLVEVWQRID